MRKITIAIISTVCLLTSCSVENGKDIFDVPYSGYTLFEADFEAVDMRGERTDFLWDIETGIGVFGSEKGVNKKFTLKKAYDDKAFGEFYGPLVSGNKIMAYYPYSEGLSLYDGNLPYSLSPYQTFNPEVSLLEHFLGYAGYAYAFSENDNILRFGYASGLLTIEVAFVEPVTITSLELTGTDTCLSGNGKVNSDMTVSIGNSGSKTLKVDFGDGVLSLSENKAATYPVVLHAGKYENIKLVLKTVEMGDIVCELDPFTIERISADDYKVTELVVKVRALGGFEVVGGLEFEPEL